MEVVATAPSPAPPAPLTFMCPACRAPLAVGGEEGGGTVGGPMPSASGTLPAPPVDGSFILLADEARRARGESVRVLWGVRV